ncbi:hypothetical protein G7074_25745 [Pedobacter sp. HDW13]|uniref:phospholipase D-like domain-containing protein n=1 Tax=unclassified Pedobacter TaxID=2628915 RepID=UPI000F599708|nr:MULTISPECIES: phospholipase D-like domain-containing protein [unclassified Pedobacter]QIL42362.1 hypothetical protein G7074_25745 [Pedobacter sp. HDW13]RQO78866.1 hypothetical protein DBR40_03840 [Pedobacter sp. KBW01]
MQNAIAFSNNDVITIAWSFGKKPVGCMGFAIYRIDNKNVETALSSFSVFKGYKIEKGQTTRDFPIQKFYWKDVDARRIGEKTGNRKFRYKIVPLKGKPGELVEMSELPIIISNEVEITANVGSNMSAYFNRGLISTQRISKALTDEPEKGGLLKRVADYKGKDVLRESLSGDMVEAITGFLDKAKDEGKIYAALYELGDPELIELLKALKTSLNIVLSNSRGKIDDTSKPKKPDKNGVLKYPQITVDHNDEVRAELKTVGAEVYDRVMPENHIGHNKFLVYTDKNDKPKSVLFGSTNWTSTGLCTQTNNTMIIEDPALAGRYMDYWKQLVLDNDAASGIAKNLQGSVLRSWCAKGESLSIGEHTLQSWFSPNTPKARSNNANELRPVDMEAVVKCINAAKHSILFLAFYPGSPSIANWSALALKQNKHLFVRGCVTNKSASEGFYYDLKGMVPPKKADGDKTPIKQDYRVFGAEAFDGKKIPEGWIKEMLNAGFAIIHDKVMVIDPFSEDCVVITGSHNLGHKASYDNDENLAIIKGNNKLALAYTTHILDVYDHFSARYFFKKNSNYADFLLKDKPELWMDKYFDAEGNIKNAQLNFWLQAKI